MFRNFDKVFKYTFKNQANTKSYKSMTIIVALILIALPALIMFFAAKSKDKDDEGIKPCGASAIYVVNEEAPDTDFDILNYLGVENYDHIKYLTYDTVEEALEVANYSSDVLVVDFKKIENDIKATIIVPENCTISNEDAGHFNDFIDQNETMIAVIASGIPMTNLGQMSMSVESKVYNTSGFAKGVDLLENEENAEAVQAEGVKTIFRYVVVYGMMFVLYMVIIMYGNGIASHVVMEKESKLMDTMLISVHPEALIFGKMLGILSAGFLQLFVWAIALVAGFIIGSKVVGASGVTLAIMTFFKAMKGMGIFTIPGIVLAVIAIIAGVVMYASLSGLAGSISNNKEEAATNNSLFIMVLLVSFYLVFFFGFGNAGGDLPMWMMFVPPVAAMVLPSALLLGAMPMGLGVAATALIVVVAVLLSVLAGKLYKMMSLYKGNKVKLSKAIGMLFSKA